jgi:tetratricopeptide (TPR) repeat protein
MSGIINFEENNPAVAIENLDLFINNVPSDESPAIDYGYKGRSYFKMQGEGTDRLMYDSLAVINIEKAISLGDTTFDYYDNFAGEFMKRKNYEKAAFFAEKAVAIKRKPDATDFAKVGTYYSAARNWVKADEFVDKALGLYKGAWVDGYALSARLKTYKGDSTFKANFMAAPLYQEYLDKLGAGKSDPKNKRNVTDALKYLAGREFQVSKDLPKAISYLEELLQIDPTNEEVKKQLEFIKSSQSSGASPGK